jgi:cold shock CspA family protein
MKMTDEMKDETNEKKIELKDKIRGIVWSYNPKLSIGTIASLDSNQRYFFHREKVVAGPASEIQVNNRVLFKAGKVEPRAGQLPYAREIEILDDLTAGDVLAGPDGGAL